MELLPQMFLELLCSCPVYLVSLEAGLIFSLGRSPDSLWDLLEGSKVSLWYKRVDISQLAECQLWQCGAGDVLCQGLSCIYGILEM